MSESLRHASSSSASAIETPRKAGAAAKTNGKATAKKAAVKSKAKAKVK